jgi:hypothetical protein
VNLLKTGAIRAYPSTEAAHKAKSNARSAMTRKLVLLVFATRKFLHGELRRCQWL